MNRTCIAFDMKDAYEARKHIRSEVVRDYGDSAYDHFLHTWDDGKRMFVRCMNCGGCLLVQKSEYHGMEVH